MPAADAIAALRAAGRCVTRTTRADAALRYGCQTCIYAIDGRAVNLGRLRQLAAEAQAAEPAPAPVAEPVAEQELTRTLPRTRPTLPGEALPPEPPAWPAPEPTLPPVAPRRPPTGEGLAGLPWDPGAPEARAAVAQRGERVGILWPVAQALTGEGVALPPSWACDGPVMAGELTLSDSLAALPLGAIAAAAAALAALPPVTAAQDAALALCRTGAVPGRPYL